MIVKQSKRGVISRLFHAKNDKEKIATWRSDLTRILHVFNVCSIVSAWRSLTLHSQTELTVNTRATVPDTHVIVSELDRNVTSTPTTASISASHTQLPVHKPIPQPLIPTSLPIPSPSNPPPSDDDSDSGSDAGGTLLPFTNAPLTTTQKTSPPPPRFQCDRCGNTFSRLHDRNRHYESTHSEKATIHKCERCRRQFSRADAKKRHQDDGKCVSSP